MEQNIKSAYLISPQIKKLPYFYKNKNLVLPNYNFEKYNLSKKNCLILDDKSMDANRYRFLDNISSKIAENYYKDNLKKYSFKELEKQFDINFIEKLIKKEILIKVSTILFDLFLANIAIKKYKLKKIFIYNESIDLEFFSLIKKYLRIKKNIDFTRTYKIKFFIKKSIFKIINIFKILIHSELILLKTIGKKINYKKNYKFAVRIDEGLKFDDYPYSPDLLLDIKGIESNDVLFYSERKLKKDLILKLKSVNNYNTIIYFKDLINKISFFSFFKNVYLKTFFIKLDYLKLIFKLNQFCSIIFKSFDNLLFWETFYEIYDIKKNINFTVDHGMTSNFLHRKHKVKTIFIYPHFTEQLSNFFYKGYPTSSDWSYLEYDEIFCDKTSKKYLDTLISYNKFNEIGFLFQNYIKFKNKEKIKNELKISNNKKTIFFYDASIGPKGVMTLNESKNFYDAINFFIQNTDFNIGLRLKTTKIINENNYIKNQISNLKKNSRFKLLNNFKIEKYSLLCVPDLIISCPISTIIFEALSLDKKLLIFNPYKRYKNLLFLIFNDSKLIQSAENFQDLLNSAENIIKNDYKINNYDKYFLKTDDSLKNLEKLII